MDLIIEDSNIGYLQVLDHLDVKKGDLLVVASDVTRLFFSEFEKSGEFPDIDKLIDSFQRAVGEEGTLLFPMYNWDFCKGKPFDIRKTQGVTGALGNAALKRSDFKRVKHPLYSFMVWGKYANQLSEMENKNSWGVGSVFDFLYHENAKWLLFDVDITHGYSFIHHVEEMAEAPYRYYKDFTADYTDENGITTPRTYSMYVRDLALDPKENFEPMQEILLEKGIAKRTIINEIPYIVVDVYSSFDPIFQDVKYNRSRNIYTYPGQND